MNFPRVALAALVAWVAYLGISFLVHRVLLDDIYTQHASIMRSEPEQMSILPIGFGFALLGFFVFSYTYAKGYEGGNGRQEGLRFGVIVGILICSFATVFQYMVWPISSSLLIAWLIDNIVEFAIYGMIVGTLYKPLPAGSRRPAAI
jgi:hypothetical protein